MTSTGTTFGETANYICDIGFSLTGLSTITCQVNQTWEVEPVCTVVSCGVPRIVKEGSSNFTGTTFGETATYSCNNGYHISGSAEIICQADANWDAEPECLLADFSCGSPPVILNGSPGRPTSVLTGGITTYTCDHGFILIGSNTATCLSTGVWTAPSTCQTTPPVYLSLFSTNYLSTLPEIPLSSVGEGKNSSLSCHTDLAACCRQLDSGVEGGLGKWHYPNGTVVVTDKLRDDLYTTREQKMVSLNHKNATNVSGGVYCCVVPTTQGKQSICANLDKDVKEFV
ncbi:protein lev-9-like [Halichondria panicea]|uniref:protein lev-9-like n=1 Tax=Halichondria panicea TaxID=6063 RepID=UPI00312B4D3E